MLLRLLTFLMLGGLVLACHTPRYYTFPSQAPPAARPSVRVSTPAPRTEPAMVAPASDALATAEVSVPAHPYEADARPTFQSFKAVPPLVPPVLQPPPRLSNLSLPIPEEPDPPRVMDGYAVAAFLAGLFVPLTWALLSVVPFIGLLSLGSVVMAIVFGIIGMRRTRREGRRGYGLALAGLIMGLVWTLVGILGIVLIILLILAWQG